MAEKKRLDVLLVERAEVESREKAQALILAGQVLVNDVPHSKPGHRVDVLAEIRIRGEKKEHVSRAAGKLAEALETFQIPVEKRTGLDIGASTGGFTQILLMRGASRVYAVDAGVNQLDWRIRSDPRVVVLEKTNARYLSFDLIGEKVDIITVDVSFISLEKVLPALTPFSHDKTDWICLIKPQFEAGRGKVGKGGIVSDPEVHQEVICRIEGLGENLGLLKQGLIPCSIKGATGNQEFLIHWKNKQR